MGLSLMQNRIKIKRAKLIGFSGVPHEVEVAEYKGKKYIVIKVGDDTSNPWADLLVKTLICIDVNMPPLVFTLPGKSIPENIRQVINGQGGMIVKYEDYIVYNKCAKHGNV